MGVARRVLFLSVCVPMQVTQVCHTCLCVCTACSAHGSRCTPLCVHQQAAVLGGRGSQALCVHVCVFLWALRPPWPHTRPVPWGLVGPVEEHEQSHASQPARPGANSAARINTAPLTAKAA